jgi:hypothetical protein
VRKGLSSSIKLDDGHHVFRIYSGDPNKIVLSSIDADKKGLQDSRRLPGSLRHFLGPRKD